MNTETEKRKKKNPECSAESLEQEDGGSWFLCFNPLMSCGVLAHAHPSEVQGEKKWKEIWTHDPLKGYASTGLL